MLFPPYGDMGSQQCIDEFITRLQQYDTYSCIEQVRHERQHDEGSQCHRLSDDHNGVFLTVLQPSDDASLHPCIENPSDKEQNSHLGRGDVDAFYAEKLECTLHPAHRQHYKECTDEKDADRLDEIITGKCNPFFGIVARTVCLLYFNDAEQKGSDDDNCRHVVGKAQADAGQKSADARAEYEAESYAHADKPHVSGAFLACGDVGNHARGRCIKCARSGTAYQPAYIQHPEYIDEHAEDEKAETESKQPV